MSDDVNPSRLGALNALHYNFVKSKNSVSIDKEPLNDGKLGFAFKDLTHPNNLYTTSPQVSTPVPEFTELSFSTTNVEVDSDGQGIHGAMVITGVVEDHGSAFIQGPDGTIQHVTFVYEHDGEIIEEQIPVNVSKADEFQSQMEPYPFSGTFSHTIANIPLNPGANSFDLLAENRWERRAIAQNVVRVAVEYPEEYVEVIFYAPGLTSIGRLAPDIVPTLWAHDQDGNIFADGTQLVIRSDGSYVDNVHDVDVYFWNYGVTFVPESQSFNLSGLLTIDGSSLDSHVFVIEESGNIADEFKGKLYTRTEDDYLDFEGAIPTIESEFISQNIGGGDVRPALLVVHMHASYDPESLNLNGQEYNLLLDRDDISVRTYHFAASNLTDINTLVPTLFVDDEWAMPHPGYSLPEPGRYGAWSFTSGVAVGMFKDYPVSAWEGLVSTGEFAWHMYSQYQPSAIIIRMVNGEEFVLEGDQAKLSAGYEVGKSIAELYMELTLGNHELTELALAGDSLAMKELSERYRLGIMFCVEMFQAIDDEIQSLDDFEGGRIVGRIFAEALVAIATAGTGAASSAVTKSAVVRQVITKMDNLDWVPSSIKLKLKSLDNGPDSLVSVLQTSRMCFVAGTLVHTSTGLKPIEDVQVGDLVLSQDPVTGLQGYKPVLQTFVTHPDQVIDLAVSGVENEVITTTGEHPFFLPAINEFVPAKDIQSGEALYSAKTVNGVYVSDLERRRGPPSSGGVFTTYNFEVADWHTYFVGHNAIWVHNSGGVTCQTLQNMIDWEITNGVDESEAFLRVLRQFPEATSTQLGAVAQELVRSRNPDWVLPDSLWTVGPEETGFANLFEHWVKRQNSNQLSHLDSPVNYLERAIEVSRQTATLGDLDPEWAVVWEYFPGGSYGPRWEKLCFNKITQEKAVKIVSGDNAGQIKTLHPIDVVGTSASTQLQKLQLRAGQPNSRVLLTRPAGVDD